MTDWLDRLLVVLREGRVDLSAEDVADIVWLAPLLDPTQTEPADEGPGSAEEPQAVEAPRPIEVHDKVDERSEQSPTQLPEQARASGKRHGELHLPGAPSGTRSGGGRPLRAPTGSALPGSLALSRALRPLRRRVPSRTRRVLDLAETVRRVAEEGIWLPAFRPARDRWLELSVVLDVGASMGPWRSVATELFALFSSLGAFRSVRVWSLETDSAPIRLQAGLARRRSAPRDPRELIDPSGRSLIVVLTDCVAESWSDGRAARLVEDWARAGPVALFQVLPEHLWARSALGLASAVRLASRGPAAANVRLESRSTDPWADPLGREGSALPVASLTPQALSAWARVVAGSVRAEVHGFRLDLDPAPLPPSITSTPSPRERLDRFWSATSPPARRLAGLLAASPAISLPVIRLVRQSLMPEGRQVHEAEVLLSGLLRIVDAPGESTIEPDELRYEFRDGVRALLLDAVPSADFLEVLNGVSSYVEENLAHGVDFRAMLADPASARGSIVLDESPFARVAAEVLLRLGGDYARMVSSLPAAPPSEPGHVVDSHASVAPPILADKAPRIVSGSDDGTVRVWDADTGAPLAQLDGHAGGVFSVAFAPDGRHIVSGSSDKTVRIWDADTGALLAQLDGHDRSVNSVAFAPDGRRIVSGSADETMRVWDADTGAPLAQLDGHEDFVNSVGFAPDGRRIVSGSYDKTVRVWDADTGAPLAQLDGHEGWVNSVVFAPDGRRIVSGSADSTVRVWDADTGAPLAQLVGHEGSVNSVAFAPDGRRIVSGSSDRTVRVWDADTGALLAQFDGHDRSVNSVAFAPDGRHIVSGSNPATVQVWDADTGAPLVRLVGHERPVSSVAFAPDSRPLQDPPALPGSPTYHAKRTQLDEDLLRRLPLPLAQLYRRARNGKTPVDRHHNAYYLAEATLKLAASARIGEALLAGLDHQSPLARSLEQLCLPSVGHWVGFLREASDYLRARPDAALLPLASTHEALTRHESLPAVREFAERASCGVDEHPPIALEAARQAARRGILGFFELVASYRNQVFGHGAQRPPAFYDELGSLLLDASAEVLRQDALFGGLTLAMARLTSGDSARSLRVEWQGLQGLVSLMISTDVVGPEPDPSEEAARNAAGRVFFVARGVRVPLHPLVVYHEDRSERERVGFLNRTFEANRSAKGGEVRRCDYLDYATGDLIQEVNTRRELTELLARLRGRSTTPSDVVQVMHNSQAEPDDDLMTSPLDTVAIIGDFELEGELGRGGSSVVYLARQRSPNRTVALKVLPPSMANDQVSLARFRREISALASCQHPNLVKIFTSGADSDRPYYSMELIEGTNLAAFFEILISWNESYRGRLREGHLLAAVLTSFDMARRRRESQSDEAEPFPSLEPINPVTPLESGRTFYECLGALFADAADALAHLHSRGIIHRDVKPSNLMLTLDGRRLVLIDFGSTLLRDRSQTLTADGTRFVGTLRYASPEQFQRNLLEIDERTDVYSLGATLYEMATLAPIFDGDTELRLVEQVQHQEPKPPRKVEPAIPRDLAAIVLHCLEKDRSRRYANARDLAEDLRHFAAGEAVSVRMPFWKR